jgi:mRNA interferase MazF
MITSAENRGWSGDVGISDLRVAGLPAPSIVRPAKIATVDARDAQRLGTLPRVDREAVASCLRGILSVALGRSSGK